MIRFVGQQEQKNKILGSFNDEDWVVMEGEKELSITKSLQQQKIMGNKIRLYHPYLCGKEEKLSLLQLLLDERYAEGCLCIPVEVIKECGYLNERMPRKKMYEFLLRIAEKHEIIGMPAEYNADLVPGEDSGEFDKAAYKADCYIVGKYSQLLQQNQYFEEVVGRLIQQAAQSHEPEKMLSYLEDMLGKRERYTWIKSGTAPVLIYYGVTYCYNVMNVMLEQLAMALEQNGVPVIRYDEQKEDVKGLIKYVGKTFRAVIGMQTYLMSVYMKELGYFLHDEIKGPKYNIVLDHPFWLRQQLMHVPDQYYVLTHDENYKKFVEKYYPKVSGCYLFPPGGIEQKEEINLKKRRYGVVFIGTYGDYREKCRLIHSSDRRTRFAANRFLLNMRKKPYLTAEEALMETLSYYRITLTDEQFLHMLYQLGSVVQCVMYYYREKTVRILVTSGIAVDVWGSSWEKCDLVSVDGLVIHKDADWKENLKILSEAKISLNVMAWHKGGFTERMANSMLAGAVLLTDETSYQRGQFRSGQECQMFSLTELDKLPELTRKILQDDEERTRIAKNGYAYAKKNHTWESRAEYLLTLIDQADRWGRKNDQSIYNDT